MLSITWADGAMEIDVTTSEIYEYPSEITEHPVETGVNVTDHVRPKNETVRFECLVSNSPIVVPRTNMDGVGGTSRSVQLQVGGSAKILQFDGPFDHVRSVHQQLLELRQSATVVSVFTGFTSLTDVVIAQYSVDRHPETGKALSFTLECRKIRIVSTMTTPVPLRRRGQRRASRGNQAATDPDSSSQTSILRRGVDSLIRALN